MRAPKVSTLRDSARVRHREYIRDIEGNEGFFKTLSHPINPGVPVLFPWLSQVASRYEKYRFHSLKFDFETSAPTSTPGTVMLAVDYDASDNAPETKAQFLAFSGASRSAPWQDNSTLCSSDRLAAKRFVRVGAAPSGSDIKLYDLGNQLVGINSTGGTLGELYVEYDVELLIPTAENSCPGGTMVSSGTVSPTDPLGSTGPVYTGPVPFEASEVSNQVRLTFTQSGSFILVTSAVGSVLNPMSVSGTAGAIQLSETAVNQSTHMLILKVRGEIGKYVNIDYTSSTTLTGLSVWVASAPYPDMLVM